MNRLSGQKPEKSSCLYHSDDDSTISADSYYEESDSENMKLSATYSDRMLIPQYIGLEKLPSYVEKGIESNLLLSKPPSLNRILNTKDVENMPPNYGGKDYETPEFLDSISGLKLPSFDKSFETPFSNRKAFHEFVRASAMFRNEPVPESISAFDSDNEHCFKQLRNRAFVEEETNECFPDPDDKVNRTSVLQTAPSSKKCFQSINYDLREISNSISKESARSNHQINNISSDIPDEFQTNESGPSESFNRVPAIQTTVLFDDKAFPSDVGETESSSPIEVEYKENIPVIKNIPKKLKKLMEICKKIKKRKLILDTETEITYAKEIQEKIKIMKDQNSTFQCDGNQNEIIQNLDLNQDENINPLKKQDTSNAQMEKEKLSQEKQEILKRHQLLTLQLAEITKMRKTDLQCNRQSLDFSNLKTEHKTESYSNKQPASSGEVLFSTQRELSAHDVVEGNKSTKLLFLALQSRKSGHQEQITEIQNRNDQKQIIETITKEKNVNNSYSQPPRSNENNLSYALKPVILIERCLPQTMYQNKDTVRSDPKKNSAPPNPLIEVKKIALPGRRNHSDMKPIYVISSTKTSNFINNSFHSQTIVRPVFVEQMHNATELKILQSRNLNNNLNEEQDFDVASVQKIEKNKISLQDKNKTKANSLKLNDPVKLLVDKKTTEFSSQNDSKDKILPLSSPLNSNSGSEILIKSDNSNPTKELLPESSKKSNPTHNPKKEMYKCTHCWRKFKTVKGFQNHIESTHSLFSVNSIKVLRKENDLEDRLAKSSSSKTSSEINTKDFNEEQNAIKSVKLSEQSNIHSFSQIHVEKLVSCLSGCKVIKNYSKLVEHLDHEHSGDFETPHKMSTQSIKKPDI